MYAAKQGGRGRWQLFDTSLREASARRVEMVSALHRALELNEIEMLLQPIVDLGDGRLAGVEALLRWRRGTQVVPPLEFVPLAEEAGLIAEIERFALAEACRLGQQLAALHGEPIAVSVNVSPRHALQGDLRRERRARAREHRVRSREPARRADRERAHRGRRRASANVLGAVRELGVSVALDDFGTGWSTLGLLRRVPFDALKIDRSFTAGLPGSRSDRALVAAIVTLARSLGVPAVAEGIERPEQHAWLREVGCDLGQGYLFARPEHGRAARRRGSRGAPRAPSSTSLVRPELLDVLPVGIGRVAARRQEAAAREGARRRRERAALDQPLDVAAVDLVDRLVLQRILLEPEVRRVDRLLVHAAGTARCAGPSSSSSSGS